MFKLASSTLRMERPVAPMSATPPNWLHHLNQRADCGRCIDRLVALEDPSNLEKTAFGSNCVGYASRALGLTDKDWYVDPDLFFRHFASRLRELRVPVAGGLIVLQNASELDVRHVSVVRSIDPPLVDERPRYRGLVAAQKSWKALQRENRGALERYYCLESDVARLGPEVVVRRNELRVDQLPRPLAERLAASQAFDSYGPLAFPRQGPVSFACAMLGVIPDEDHEAVAKIDSKTRIRDMPQIVRRRGEEQVGDIALISNTRLRLEIPTVVVATLPRLTVAYRPYWKAPVESNVDLDALFHVIGKDHGSVTFWCKVEGAHTRTPQGSRFASLWQAVSSIIDY